MKRALVGLLVCVAIGAGVAFSGVDRLLPLERVLPARVPEHWSALPPSGRVDVTLVDSEAVVAALASGLSSAEVAHARPGALALVDGRVYAIGTASARQVLRALAWDGLPIDVRQVAAAELDVFAAPTPATPAWRARRHAWVELNRARDLAAAHPGFALAGLTTGSLLLLNAFLSLRPRRRREGLPPEPTPWRRRRAEAPVRVVLVPDAATLAQVRVAIGEEHVVASTEHAFAFADGWVLAVRKGSVFELLGELGWRMRPIEMTSRSELAGEGHALSPLPGDDPADALGLLEALHVCGPLAHGTVPRIATSAL
ncbi:MAG: hypothetical protein ACQGVC_19140 [Myxococcota bacterium]